MSEDPTSYPGALRLKKKIEDYWAQLGYHVDVRLVSIGFSNKLRATGYMISSDMINGLPRNKNAARKN